MKLSKIYLIIVFSFVLCDCQSHTKLCFSGLHRSSYFYYGISDPTFLKRGKIVKTGTFPQNPGHMTYISVEGNIIFLSSSGVNIFIPANPI